MMNGLEIALQIVGALTLGGTCVGLTALYWRRRHLKLSHLGELKQMVDHYRMARKAQSKVEFMYNILYEVQALQEGLDSYMKLFSSPDMTMSCEDWSETSRLLIKRVDQMSATVNSALLMMQYEDMAEVRKDDEVLVNEFCKDVFESCFPHLTDGVEATFETSLSDDHRIHTNMACLDVLLRYLILCSMEYTSEGHITLSVMPNENKRNELVFTLSDTGEGIPDDMKNVVFDRLPLSNIRHKITGVRLRTCRTLVRLLGGCIHVDSRYEGGTSIVFSIC